MGEQIMNNESEIVKVGGAADHFNSDRICRRRLRGGEPGMPGEATACDHRVDAAFHARVEIGQPRDAQLVIDKVRQLPKRSKLGDNGYDALAIVVIDMINDGSKVRLIDGPPAPQPGDIYHYASMIDRLAHIYATRFKDL
jgi:hypothetical protein